MRLENQIIVFVHCKRLILELKRCKYFNASTLEKNSTVFHSMENVVLLIPSIHFTQRILDNFQLWDKETKLCSIRFSTIINYDLE